MVILKNIPRILSPELLSVLARMGHGDEIGKLLLYNPFVIFFHIALCLLVVLADANFPSASTCASGPELVRADGKQV